MNRTRLALAVGVSLLGVAAAPAASNAATLAPTTVDGVDYIGFAAAPGERNTLQVRSGPAGTVAFVDAGATIDATAPACVEISAHEARCADGLVPALSISLGDGDDRLTVDVDKRGVLDGGAGDDSLTGGAGDEKLSGAGGDDVLDGRGGADLLSGQDGRDTVRYAGRTAPVSVDLATLTLGSEGQAGEHDTVTADNESVVGGNGADTLTGNALANVLDGGAGNDTLDGNNGDDTVLGGAGNDAVDGGAGNDMVDGGAGNDRTTGGAGADDVRGGPGSDVLRGRDGIVDRLDCGPDGDAVDADDGDRVAGCETGTPVFPAAPATPLPTPFSFLYGVFKLPSTAVTLEHGHVTLTVICPAETPVGRCSGVISLERFGHGAPAKGKAKARSSRRTRRFRVGEKSYAVRAGRKAKVRVRISSAGRREINRTGTARLKVLLRRTKRARKATRIGTLKVHASRRTKRRPARSAS
jgi:RTX calcium-binding nonapeptide repeat (4 copies)